jgi:HD-GYP domain-containing protein (c-di-GMP phosphodiesterase class II)
LLARYLRTAGAVAGASAGRLLVVRGAGPAGRLAAVLVQDNSASPTFAEPSLPCISRAPAAMALATGEILAVTEPGTDSGWRLCVPMRNHLGQAIGVIELTGGGGDSAAAPPTGKPVKLIAVIARLAGGLIERQALLATIRNQKRAAERRDRLLAAQEQRIKALQADSEDAFLVAVELLARGAEIHDEGTGNHIKRVNEYSYFLAGLAGQSREFCARIRYSAQLHDIGKLAVDAALLKKRGPLTPAERAEMDGHARYGHQILSSAPRLAMAADIALCHHEKWDGSGYPDRRRGDDIPLAARIVAIADVYDALRAERPYKPGLGHAETVAMIADGPDSEKHFDPAILALFRARHAGMNRIWEKLGD